MLTVRNSVGLVMSQPQQEKLFMNVKIIRDTVAGGVPVFIGDVVDLPEQEAKAQQRTSAQSPPLLQSQ